MESVSLPVTPEVPGQTKYPFQQQELGKSFVVVCRAGEWRAVRRKVRSALTSARHRGAVISSYRIRCEPEEVEVGSGILFRLRVWRTA